MAEFELESNTKVKVIIEIIKLTFDDNEDIYPILQSYYGLGFSQLGPCTYSDIGRMSEITLYKYINFYERNIFKRIYRWQTLKNLKYKVVEHVKEKQKD